MDGDELEKALAVAHRTIAQRDRTAAEMRSRLEAKGFDAGVVEAALAELEATGLLDDTRFAHRFAEDKRSLEQWGPERIERDLRRRGVAEDLIEEAVAARDGAAELDAALELLAQRVAPPDDDRRRDRAWRMLVRKGYPSDLAYEAVRAHGRRGAA